MLRRSFVSVIGRALPVGLVVTAAIADVLSAPQLAFAALVVAVPFVAVAALSAYGELIDADEAGRDRRGERLQAVCAGSALVLLVVGTAARAPLVGEGVVPRISTSALVLCLVVLFVQAVAAGAAQVRQQVRVPNLEPEL